ncbi:MAG: hypothetical protein J0L94_04220 [Rhodothermia bacterium]|nr:hypothetical protein [Rhodothermia bacterium]
MKKKSFYLISAFCLLTLSGCKVFNKASDVFSSKTTGKVVVTLRLAQNLVIKVDTTLINRLEMNKKETEQFGRKIKTLPNAEQAKAIQKYDEIVLVHEATLLSLHQSIRNYKFGKPIMSLTYTNDLTRMDALRGQLERTVITPQAVELAPPTSVGSVLLVVWQVVKPIAKDLALNAFANRLTQELHITPYSKLQSN